MRHAIRHVQGVEEVPCRELLLPSYCLHGGHLGIGEAPLQVEHKAPSSASGPNRAFAFVHCRSLRAGTGQRLRRAEKRARICGCNDGQVNNLYDGAVTCFRARRWPLATSN